GEDRFMADVAADYAKFIHAVPWYEFPFGARLRALWSQPSDGEPWTLRRVERRVAATLELGGKAAWAWVIAKATAGAYEPEASTVLAWAKGRPRDLVAAHPGIRTVERLDARSRLVAIPRYEELTRAVKGLAERHVRLVEIAGNRTILVTLIAPIE